MTCDISIKQRLIEELETTQRRLHSMKVQYDEKISQLTTKIRETEVERDKVLANIGKERDKILLHTRQDYLNFS